MNNKATSGNIFLMLTMLISIVLSIYTDSVITNKLMVATMIICSLIFIKNQQTISNHE